MAEWRGKPVCWRAAVGADASLVPAEPIPARQYFAPTRDVPASGRWRAGGGAALLCEALAALGVPSTLTGWLGEPPDERFLSPLRSGRGLAPCMALRSDGTPFPQGWIPDAEAMRADGGLERLGETLAAGELAVLSGWARMPGGTALFRALLPSCADARLLAVDPGDVSLRTPDETRAFLRCIAESRRAVLLLDEPSVWRCASLFTQPSREPGENARILNRRLDLRVCAHGALRAAFAGRAYLCEEPALGGTPPENANALWNAGFLFAVMQGAEWHEALAFGFENVSML